MTFVTIIESHPATLVKVEVYDVLAVMIAVDPSGYVTVEFSQAFTFDTIL